MSPPSSVVAGSCLCGQFRFQIRGPILFLKNCHCSRCRKMSGSTFLTFARAETQHLEILSGADEVTTYEKARGNIVAFCRRCGSPVPHPPADSPQVEFAAGLLDDDPVVGVSFHTYVGSRAPWHEVADDHPQFDQQVF